MKNYLFVLFVSLIFVNACKKDDGNPYDSLHDPGGNSPVDTTNPASITGLQKNIFSVKCAIPSCHGGGFEPDFRTVQSSYNTLVYQKVKKNTMKDEFRFRVYPYDTAKSWLHHRITYNDTLIARMPLYANPLTESEIKNIDEWILSGAPDINGKISVKPNENPQINGYAAYDENDNRIDGNRAGWSQPFTAPPGQQIKILMYIDDDNTNRNLLEGNILKLSLFQDDFTNAVSVLAEHKSGPQYWGWVAKVNTSVFPNGSQVFMRYYVKDPEHQELEERPVQQSYSYLKGYYSFVIN